jgi:hypothetical protein
MLTVMLPELFISGESIVISPSQSREVSFKDCWLILYFSSAGDISISPCLISSISFSFEEEQE